MRGQVKPIGRWQCAVHAFAISITGWQVGLPGSNGQTSCLSWARSTISCCGADGIDSKA
jgi:hypothetical protein